MEIRGISGIFFRSSSRGNAAERSFLLTEITDGLKEGDQIMSSGIGGIFPKGIPVGVVSRTSVSDSDIFKYVELKPMTDFSRLQGVFVIIE